MECRICRESLTAFLDSELSTDENEDLERHLKSCPDCQKDYTSHRIAAQLTDQLPSVIPGADLWYRIESQINPARPPTVWHNLLSLFRRRWVPVSALAEAAGIIFILVVLLIPRTNPVEVQFQTFIEEREILQAQHERLFRSPFDRNLTGRNPFQKLRKINSRNPFQE
jgi:anti-sigma factor RsiW